MITIKVHGGLGNQMFQYAYGRHVTLRNKTELMLDLSFYAGARAPDETPRNFTLPAFNIDPHTKTSAEPLVTRKSFSYFIKVYKKIMRILVGDKTLRFHPKSLEVHDGALLAGFWQSEKYFKPIENIIRKEFTLKNPLRTRAAEWVEKIKATKIPVSLHIRHGDYVTDPTTRAYHGICTIEYYEQAYQKMLELLGKNGGVSESDLGIFIFSDDIGWARENIRFGAPIHLVSSTDIAEYEEIVMMSKCSHHIIANSSFSWWGAWLNPSKEKIVVAPQRWNMDPRNDTSDVVPSEWVRI